MYKSFSDLKSLKKLRILQEKTRKPLINKKVGVAIVLRPLYQICMYKFISDLKSSKKIKDFAKEKSKIHE